MSEWDDVSDLHAAPADAQPTYLSSSWDDVSEPHAPEASYYGKPFVDTFKQGIKDAGDFLTVNHGKGYGSGSNPEFDAEMADFKAKHQAGTANRQDYERMVLGSLMNTPTGKAMGAIGGLVPEFNILGTTLNHWINPAAAKATGTNPEDWAIGEMVLPGVAKGIKSLRGNKPPSIGEMDDMAGMLDIPDPDPLSITSKKYWTSGAENAASTIGNLASVSAAGTIADKATYPIRHPLSTAASIIDVPASIARWGSRPAVQALLDGDNPITGEPGLRTLMGTDTAVEGARLGDKFGINFSAGEMTGSPFARGMEDALAQTAKWGPKFAETQRAKTDAILSNYKTLLDKVSSDPAGPAQFGGRLSNAYNSTLDSLIKTRRAQADIDFKAAFEGSSDAGKYIQSNNLFKTLNELKDEGNARLLTDSKRLGSKIGNQLLSKLSVDTKKGNKMADNITIEELGNGLSDFGAEAANRDLPDATRRVYTRIYDALQKDLDAEINNPHGDPERIAMLKVARDNYLDNSNKISDIQKTTLGNILGNGAKDSQGNLMVTPESVANKFRELQPSELKSTLKFLDDNHPEIADAGRRHILQQALDSAHNAQGQRGAGGTKPFPKAEFVKNLPSPEKLNAMFGDSQAARDIQDVAAATNRIIDWGAERKGSQTAGRMDHLTSLLDVGKGLLIKSLVSDNVAQDLLNPMTRHRMAVEARKIQGMKEPGAAKMPDPNSPDFEPPKFAKGGRVKKNPNIMIAKTRLQMLRGKV